MTTPKTETELKDQRRSLIHKIRRRNASIERMRAEICAADRELRQVEGILMDDFGFEPRAAVP
jgi:hypothetical protein